MNEHVLFMTSYLLQTWQELADYLVQHPEKLARSQLDYWEAWQTMCGDYAAKQGRTDEQSSDKRFQHSDWQNHLMFSFIQRSWQLLNEHTAQLSNNLDASNNKPLQKFRFYSKQYLDAIAPSNFINTNPEILSQTLQTNGANLIAGFNLLKEDLERGQGNLQIKLSDLSQFELGKNIACTKGEVIFQNDLMQLIHYTASTTKIYSKPLLIIPPWINKYYILDLQQDNSMVKWLVDQGYNVYMISWVNPSRSHHDTQFSDYLFDGPVAAIREIQNLTRSNDINLMGYCIGGTLLGCLLAWLARSQFPVNVSSATFLASLLDFSEPGELGTFIDENQVTMLEAHMRQKGYLDGGILAFVFNALRSNDLIWSAFVNHYLKGEPPKAFDMLYWNADSTNIPAATHSFYLRNMYLQNLLIQPDQLQLDNTPLDLGRIQTPCYFLATKEDHIVPWQSCYRGQLNLPQQALNFVLAGSGHVAGIINPPHKMKYGYWTNKTKPRDPEQFIASADFHTGSWWIDWHNWLANHAGNLIEANAVANATMIEEAPGSYVKQTLDDIE